jgi:hypothetical protein
MDTPNPDSSTAYEAPLQSVTVCPGVWTYNVESLTGRLRSEEQAQTVTPDSEEGR